ncbi:transporter [Segetibacter koreensis]|uniref:transporter n=1 Tax=Segetibacter koreensis TaxID=398037 RepID=UPI00036CC9C2|nr:transporter [Segetibacter koreensis]
MKRILLVVIVLFAAATTIHAQDTIVKTTTRTVYSRWERNNLNLRIGPEVGIPIGDFGKTHNLGIGGSALLDVPLARRFSLVFYAGFRSYGGKDQLKRATIYPLRAGVNYKLSPNFYVTGQVGESTVHYGVSKTSVSQAVGIGYFNGFLDLGARWDHDYAQGGLSSLVFQARYVITFGLKRK